jgi:hypothetical protein
MHTAMAYWSRSLIKAHGFWKQTPHSCIIGPIAQTIPA